jgi:predicted RNA-binding protein (virulence factor B family)
MSLDDHLGRVHSVRIVRFATPGAYVVPVDGSPTDTGILLPGPEIPPDAKEGTVLDVFLYRDSDDRPVVTTRTPKVEVGEVAFLSVAAVGDFGAFFEWGLAKDLLVPFAEQTRDVAVGERHPVGLYVDDTGRLAGTMRVSELLRAKGKFTLDEWVEGEAWRNDPDIGLFVILERAFVGLVPASEPHTLTRGQAGRFRVSNVLPDGRVELSLRGHAHEEMEADAAKVLARLRAATPPRVSDKSTPEELRDLFGISKKAFKRAVGRLLKAGEVTVDGEGCVVAKPA